MREVEQIDDAAEMLDEPCEGDYVLSPCGSLGGKTLVSVFGGRNVLGEYIEEDDAIAAIRAKMDADKFWPNVWRESDHGNLCLLMTS